MYNIMKKLISKRYYSTKEDAQEKCDVFYVVGRINEEQYKELSALIKDIYE